MNRAIAFVALSTLIGCAHQLPVASFAGDGRPFDPVRFFQGPIQSWGVIENRSGQPTEVVRTDGIGVAEGPDGVHFRQRLQVGHDQPSFRDWHMRRIDPGHFEATANDMVGTVQGEAAGRAFHWTWTLALHPGNPLTNVGMDQWWYLDDDGSMLNRTIVTKLGLVVAAVTEHFVRTPSSGKPSRP